jgi:dienelactone hydrolase
MFGRKLSFFEMSRYFGERLRPGAIADSCAVIHLTGRDDPKNIQRSGGVQVHDDGMISSKSGALTVLLICVFVSPAFAVSPQSAVYTSNGRQVNYKIFGTDGVGPMLILLHGASGPGAPVYREQAERFVDHGYTVLLLHYFDATGSSTPSDKNYELWQGAVSNLIEELRKNPSWKARRICLMGFSLGASVALAAGSQNVPVAAIAEWYGSLPDAFFERRKGMPPLLVLHGQQDPIIPIVNAQQLARLCEMERYTCESHFYVNERHGFTGAALSDANKRTLDFLSRKLR